MVSINGSWESIPEDIWGHPHEPYNNFWSDKGTRILILIASLRESRLTRTLLDAFDQALYPERIFIGVVQQV